MKASRGVIVIVIALALPAPLAAQRSTDPECYPGEEGKALTDEEFACRYGGTTTPPATYTVRCFQGGAKIFDRDGLLKAEGVFRTKEGKEVRISKSSDTTCIVEEED